MTDETTDEATAVDTLEPAPDESAAESGAPAAVEAPPAEPVSFWHRPNVERYLLPLITPIIVVIGLVVFVLNISRVFLAGHGHIPVVVGTIITVLILVGATILSNSARLRSQTMILTTATFVFVVLASGWLVLGHSQEKGEAGGTIPAQGPVTGPPIEINALPSIQFTPVSLTMETGLHSVTLTNQSGATHTLDFDNPATLFAGLIVNSQGEKKTSRIFFGEPGDYTYFCAITGHRATMNGVIHVTGDPITLADAEAKGKPAAGAETEAPA